MPRKKTKGLTPRQRDALDVILTTVEETGRFPTIRDIGAEMGISSTQPVVKHLAGLEEKGYLERDGSNRLNLTDKARPTKGLPLIGEVAAGYPITAIDHIEERIELHELYGEGHFMTRVRGDSMEDAGIADGDFVVVRQQQTLQNGETGVFFLGDEQEVTAKVFYDRGDHFVLEPRNDIYDPIEIEKTDPDFRIGGKIVALMRRL